MSCEVTFYPDKKSIKVKAGTTVLDAAKRARAMIRTRCGGHASCLMCKVTVLDQSGLSPIASKEEHKLGDLINRSIRLSCQAKILDDTDVYIPEDPLKAAVRAQLEKQRKENDL